MYKSLKISSILLPILVMSFVLTYFYTITYSTPLLSEVETNALKYPRIYGNSASKNTVIIRFNPQCEPCRNFWITSQTLFERLISAETQVLLLGTGYKDDGIAIMQYTAMLTLYDKQLARKFLTDILKIGMYFDNVHDFFEKWLKVHGKNIDITQWKRQYTGYISIYKETLKSITEIDKRFSISGVPNVIVNTTVLEPNQKSVEGILTALP